MITTQGGNISLGPSAPPRRKFFSGFKCLLFSALTLVLLGVALVLSFIIRSLSHEFFTPHKDLYFEGVADPGAVVRPLVDREQTFDLAATVWLRTSQPWTHLDVEGNNAQTRKKDGFEKQENDSDELLVEEPLRNENLTNYDLRGSVVLIPNSPSLLDHVTNFSSYIPDSAKPLPVRTWPYVQISGQPDDVLTVPRFPLASHEVREKNLADEALESFGVSIPLIQFHGAPTQCADKETSDGEPDGKDKSSSPVFAYNSSTPGSSLQITDGKALLLNHPYIVTRAHIRVVDETKLFDRKAYDEAHQILKEGSCGRIFFAFQSIAKNAQRLQWQRVSHHRISVEVFQNSHSFPPEQDFVDVTWKVSFAGRTPTKMAMASMIDNPNWYSFDESGHDRIVAHDSVVLTSKLSSFKRAKWGLRQQDRRERTSKAAADLGSALVMLKLALPISILTERIYRVVVSFAIACLNTRYWFTRQSTVGISIPGTALLVASSVLEEVDSIATHKTGPASHYATALLFAVVDSVILLAPAVKAILRVEVGWWKGWIPTLRMAKATHSERASERMEGRTTWVTKIGLLLSLMGASYFFQLERIQIIKAAVPDPKAANGFIPPCVPWSMGVTAVILQLVLNWRARSYAGRYRFTSVLVLALFAVSMAQFVPALVGEVERRPGMQVGAAVQMGLWLVEAWQALVWQSVPQVMDEDHIE
ncbi:hypothetical protein H0H81_001765 [Sphagnurus paluster]|uniref:Uncharacterized protein n=1 Tax=Sphagnurus paluster TaxID=117069 RepID=A0A9P7FMG5_9AGAR|nr:hypothetical protein H0H81_001765 [Sphagnurus paluster]